LALSIIKEQTDFDEVDFSKKFKIPKQHITQILEDPLFFEEVWSTSFSHILIPSIPEIVQRWRDRCLTGDVAALKLLLAVVGKTKPEEHKHVHLHTETKHLQGEALDRKIDELTYKLRSLQKESA
jgi:hypothetical protein